jgi:hypothetical protein
LNAVWKSDCWACIDVLYLKRRRDVWRDDGDGFVNRFIDDEADPRRAVLEPKQ